MTPFPGWADGFYLAVYVFMVAGILLLIHARDPSRDRTHGRIYRVTYDGRPLLTPAKIAGEPIERLLEVCHEVSGSDATLTWVSRAFLEEQKVEPWSELPLWIPEYPGFNRFDASRAVAAGLTTREVEETVSDTLTWDRGREQRWPMDAGLPPEREAELLAEWRGRA